MKQIPSSSDSNTEEPEASARKQAEAERALRSFDRLLNQILSRPRESRPLVKALTIAQYVCERLNLEAFQVRQYLDRILCGFEENPIGDEEQSFYSSATVLWAIRLNGSFTSNAMQLRRRLSRAGVGLHPSEPPDLKGIYGFAARLGKPSELKNFWNIAVSTRTVQEEAKALWICGHYPADANDFPQLSRYPEWQILRDGPSNRVHLLTAFTPYCPTTKIAIPVAQSNRLHEKAVATCTCGRVLLCEEM